MDYSWTDKTTVNHPVFDGKGEAFDKSHEHIKTYATNASPLRI